MTAFNLFGSSLVAGLYVASVSWLGYADIWLHHFYQPGPVYVGYNVCRLIFLFFFACSICYLGTLTISIGVLSAKGLHVTAIEYTLLSFFVGSSVLNLVAFTIGLTGLYYRWIALTITTALVFFSFPVMRQTIPTLFSGLRSLLFRRSPLTATITVTLVVATALVILSKCLFPSCDHDVLTHYNPYYQTILDNHHIWPNHIWYHFYFTKGAGITFLAALITDHTAAALVSSSFVVAAAFIVFSCVKRITGETDWALLGMAICACAVYCCDPNDGLWPIFQKQHEIMAGMVLSTFWMASLLPSQPDWAQRRWAYLWGLLLAAQVIFVHTSFAITELFVFALGCAYLMRRRFAELRLVALFAAFSLLCYLQILLFNYATTGLYDITPTRFFWDLADQNVFSRWVSPYLVAYMLEGSAPHIGSFNPLELDPGFLFRLFRFDKFPSFLVSPPILLVLVLVFLGSSFAPAASRRVSSDSDLSAVLLFALVAALLSPLGGAPGSTYRYFSFALNVGTIGVVALWHKAITAALPRSLHYIASIFVLGLATAVLAYDLLRFSCTILQRDFLNQVSFIAGRLSFADAYASKGVFEPAIARAREYVGLNTKIVYLHQSAAAGAVRGKALETEVSYGYSNWHKMVFGDPAEAKAALQAEGIDFFLLDSRMELFGGLPFSPLFGPGSIEKHLEVVWHEDTYLLLGWIGRDPAAKKIGATEGAWAERLEKSRYRALYQRIAHYHKVNRGAAQPVRLDKRLPPVPGFNNN